MNSALMDKYGIETIRKCRRFLTLGVYQFTQEFLNNIGTLKDEYHGTGVKGETTERMKALQALINGPVPDRLLESAIITASMGKIAGRDPHRYITEFMQSQRSSIYVITDSVESKDLLSDILSSSVTYQEIGNVTGKVTIRHLLSDATDRERIGSLDVGLSYACYVDKRKGATARASHYLIIEWSTLLMNLLRRNKPQEYGRFETPQKLKARLSTDPCAIEWSAVLRKRIGSKRKFLKVGVKTSDVTVYDLTNMIEEWESDD